MKGRIKRFGSDFGFITTDDGNGDVFFHRSNVLSEFIKQIAIGCPVSFEIQANDKGRPEAFNIEADETNPVAQLPADVSSPSDDQPSENDALIKKSKWGRVKYFKDSHGFIIPKEGGPDIFVHFSDICGSGYKTLFRYEEVLFDTGEDERGRPRATNVRPAPVAVLNGKIISFDDDRGKIQPNDGSSVISFFAESILDKDLSEYDENELVKFRVAQSDSGPIAVRISLLDRRKPLEKFTDFSKLDWLIEQLAKKTAKESWNYRVNPTQYPYPILENYLFYTFKRLEQEDKVLFSKDRYGEPVACFNTGLATPTQEELYAFFTRAKNPVRVHASKSVLETAWVIAGCYKSTDAPMLNFSRMPELATYFQGDSFKNLVFDHNLDFRINTSHILEDRLERFLSIPNLPEFLRDREQLRSKFDTAVELAKRRVRRNYKTAIPTFNRGKINLLLPLCIVKKDTADLALLVERRTDYDGKSDFYVGWTVLTLDMAYNNARLLARPDTEWLMP